QLRERREVGAGPLGLESLTAAARERLPSAAGARHTRQGSTADPGANEPLTGTVTRLTACSECRYAAPRFVGFVIVFSSGSSPAAGGFRFEALAGDGAHPGSRRLSRAAGASHGARHCDAD